MLLFVTGGSRLWIFGWRPLGSLASRFVNHGNRSSRARVCKLARLFFFLPTARFARLVEKIFTTISCVSMEDHHSAPRSVTHRVRMGAG
ncbi:hypothetical protein BJ166DRAFT_532855 [Pestalotiopsis sp. NC0098]|nr:hypothetical protein BJ166DRAFT_532855 [Pestalotiopsis sp. NC0098]